MIDLIGFSATPSTGNIYIAWDKNGIKQKVFEPEQKDFLELLLASEYIVDYHMHDSADVAIMVDGRKHWLSFERFLEDEASDQLCINILHSYLNTHV